MPGTIAGIWKAGKAVIRIGNAARLAFDDRADNPKPEGKTEEVVVGVSDLIRSFKAARQDGTVTKEEVVGLVADVVVLALNVWLGTRLKLVDL